MRLVKELYQDYDIKDSFTDAILGIYYLKQEIFSIFDLENIEEVTLFDDYNHSSNWDILCIYPIYLTHDNLYYILQKEQGEFCFHELSREDAFHYAKTMKGDSKHLIYSKNYFC